MKNFLIAFLVFLIWSVFGLWLYSLLQDTGETSSLIDNDSVLNTSIPSPNEFENINSKFDTSANNKISSAHKSVSNLDNELSEKTIEHSGLYAENENGETIFNFSNGIAVLKNSTEIDIPESVLSFKNQISEYLSTRPNTEVHIQSIYSPNENIETPNLGVIRGLKIKEILLASGISENRIVIKPTIKDITFDNEGTFNNAISFLIKPFNYERIENRKDALPVKKVIYPQFSTSGIQVDETLTELLSEIKELCVAHPDLKIQIVGHTDNIGNAEDNYKQGLVYARQVRWYLITKGKIDRSRISAISKGESDAIDTNNTKQGRNTNRRIEILFM
ncbi:OmpA family protein [Cochleicola gelatinilyticus]|uniref:OmpA-like domain-containing protein n=1 Tax=Cochleicola gelatinilyticus TaxID=1763537 RepID=A0A167H058_9FLAO|nr:OmpA family protein [Cochleicola gelatinilyticus]OAB78077.1 hypothetical protein ULVI_11375 [Cochleicola gelatinilyticus]